VRSAVRLGTALVAAVALSIYQMVDRWT
jgi:hypothetical protein